jgi:hypothetical protein
MDVESFFTATSVATANAFASANNNIVKDIRVGGLHLRLQFAGNKMLPFILPAIEHLLVEANSENPQYLIDIWDSTSTNSNFPVAPCSIDDIEWRGEIKGLKSNRFESAFFSHARMLTVLDHENRRGTVCFADSTSIPAFELACPLRGILSWILRRNNIVMLHAAAVGTADGTVLIGGNSGAGKSSTALRCLVGGLNYLGDDICAISNEGATPMSYSVYSSGKTLTADLKKFPELLPSLHAHFDEYYEKEIFFFNSEFSSQLATEGELLAVIIPHQDASLEIGFEKLSFAKVLSVISTSTKSLLPDAGNEMFHALSAVLHSVPCYQFNLGNDPKKIANTLSAFIKKLKVNNGEFGV